MTVSQKLEHINENTYDDLITITDIPAGHFPAVTSNTLLSGESTREIVVQLMPLSQAPGGTMSTASGLYAKQEAETAVKVSVEQDGKEIVTNTQSY